MPQRRKVHKIRREKSVSLTLLLVGLFILGVVLLAVNYFSLVVLTIWNVHVTTASLGIVVLLLGLVLAIAILRYPSRTGKYTYHPAIYDPPRLGQVPTSVKCPDCGANIPIEEGICQNCGYVRPTY